MKKKTLCKKSLISLNLFFFYILCQDEESAGEEEEEKEEKAISLFGALKIPGVVEFSLWYDPLFFSTNLVIKNQFLASIFIFQFVLFEACCLHFPLLAPQLHSRDVRGIKILPFHTLDYRHDSDFLQHFLNNLAELSCFFLIWFARIVHILGT